MEFFSEVQLHMLDTPAADTIPRLICYIPGALGIVFGGGRSSRGYD